MAIVKGFPSTRQREHSLEGTQVAEGLAKDSMANEGGTGSPGWRLLDCRNKACIRTATVQMDAS